MSLLPQFGWYALYVRPRHEKKVHERLMEKSVETYLPLVPKERKWSDRTKIVYNPLIPSYVFVKLTSVLDYKTALSINGALSFIRFGSKFALVRDFEIENIKLFLASNLTDFTTQVLPVKGEIRRIKEGALKGLECEVLRVGTQSKVIVYIKSIAMQLTATIPLSSLETC